VVNIYGLIDPKTKELRYVGKTVEPLTERLRRHKYCTATGRSVNWIKSLKVIGLEPEIFLIERVSKESWVEKETFWIEYFRFIGSNLANLQPGGEGAPLGNQYCKGFKHSKEFSRQLSERQKGIPKTLSQRKAMSKSRKGVPWTKEKWRIYNEKHAVRTNRILSYFDKWLNGEIVITDIKKQAKTSEALICRVFKTVPNYKELKAKAYKARKAYRNK